MKIPFAKHVSNDSILDVETANKSVDYLCPVCNETVRLRGGDKVKKHFYHSNNLNCSPESIIHQAYKTVFAQYKILKTANNTLRFDRVDLEKGMMGIVADSIGYIGDTEVVIEFANTSFIKESKLKKLQKINLLCIEISIDKECTTIELIKNHLSSQYGKEIIHNPRTDDIITMRNNFIAAYRKVELERDQAIKRLSDFDNQKIKLFFNKDCKNGAKHYKSYRLKGIQYDAFVGNHNCIDLIVKS